MSICTLNLILLSVIFSAVVCAEEKSSVNMSKVFANVNSDPPQPSDLKRYLKAIKGIINCYVGDPEPTMNHNTLFGLFLAKVNLKHSLLRSNKISSNIRIYIENIVDSAETLISLISESINFPEKFYIDDEMFLSKLNNFYPDLIPVIPTDIDNVLKTGPDLCVYLNETMHIPGSFWKQYGKCFEEMTDMEKKPDYPSNCSQQYTCNYNKILNATEAGYILSHKVILLVLTNYLVGCHVTPDDESLIKSLCERAYIESIYIVGNNFVNLDLLMEFVGICAVVGDSNFIRSSWLDHGMSLQTRAGCFVNEIEESARNKCQDYRYNSIHFTAASLLAVTGAARYVLEKYFIENSDSRYFYYLNKVPFLHANQDNNISVTLCGVTGNSNFFQRDWLETTLELQQRDGNFINPVDEVSYRQCRRRKTNSMDPIPYTHFTAVSLAGIASAIRFILEKYY